MDVTLLKQSLKIRVGFIALQCVSNLLLPDHESDAFSAPSAPDAERRPLDGAVSLLLGGLHRWDAHYFLHVAQHGYTHEPTLAFLPGLPLLAGAGAAPLLAARFLSPPAALLAAAVALNALLSALAAQALLALSARVLRCPARARTAALLFCWSPAAVFLTAPYSEALFACLGFTGMLLCETGRLWGAAAAFGFAACTRSNGTLFVGFLVYSLLKDQFGMMFPSETKENVIKVSVPKVLLYGVWRLAQAAVLTLLALAAFCVYQLYAFVLYCTPGRLPMAPHVQRFVERHGYVIPGDMTSPWCNQTLPMSYGYIQDHYWDVGFLRYYTLRQLPNFMLAAPAVVLVLCGSVTYLRRWALKVVGRAEDGAVVNPLLLPYVLHAAALTCFMVLCAHVQVTTRVLASSSPVMYWFAADILHGPAPAVKEPARRRRTEAKRVSGSDSCPGSGSGSGSVLGWLAEPPGRGGCCVQLYFLAYAVLGTCLFSNGLPWT